MSKVLSLVTNVRPQPWAWAPLIDGLVDDAVLQLSPDGDKAMHWKPFCLVLLSYGNNFNEVNGLKCLFRYNLSTIIVNGWKFVEFRFSNIRIFIKKKRILNFTRYSVDALRRCVGKHLDYFEANVFRIIFANFCQNRLDFADDVIKTFWFDIFLSQFQIMFTYKTQAVWQSSVEILFR